jgi:DNA-binding response OmpR family regulator
MRRILLVEDDKNILFVMEAALTSEHFVIDSCKNASEAQAALKVTDYDLLILDWNLPDESTGLELCQKYRSNGGNRPIMLVTARTEVVDKLKGFEAGADDYLVKPFDTEELIARAKALLRRPINLEGKILKINKLELNVGTYRVLVNGNLVDLLPKEFAILELLMRNVDHYFTAETILSRIWPKDSSTSTDSVRTHIKTLRKKLLDQGLDLDIENKRGLGYRLSIQNT